MCKIHVGTLWGVFGTLLGALMAFGTLLARRLTLEPSATPQVPVREQDHHGRGRRLGALPGPEAPRPAEVRGGSEPPPSVSWRLPMQSSKVFKSTIFMNIVQKLINFHGLRQLQSD